MPKKGENIYKRKDGRWEGRYIRLYASTGKPKYGYIYGKTYNDVKQRLLEMKVATKHKTELIPAKPIHYKEVLDDWLHLSKINTKESTYARYAHLVNNHITPYWGDYQLSQITTQMIEGFIEKLLVDGRLDHNGGLSPKTITDILTIVKSTMEYAKYKNYAVSCNLNRVYIKKTDSEMRVLSHSEQAALVKVLMHNMDSNKFGVLLSLYTGIRIGELCALKWEDMCIPQSTLKIRKTMQRIQNVGSGESHKTKVIITKPKSQCSIREIPLPAFITDMAREFSTTPKVFVLSGDADKYVEPRTMQNRFKSYVTESGIADTNFHALRHTFATRCVEAGFELKSLSEILGHANVNITLNRYVHSSFELKSSNMNKLSLPV